MTNNNDFSGASGGGRRFRYKPEMNVSAFSPEERVYLLGLYFADGWVHRKYKSTQILWLSFQGDEAENVGRVAEMFRRAGLNPHVYYSKDKYAIEFCVIATNTVSLFPVKEEVHSMDHACFKWMKDGGLELPFIAGLIDGDGCVYVKHACGRGYIFGWLKVVWLFSQISYPFLVDFVSRYVNGLVGEERKGASVSISSATGRTVSILASGREALVRGGIAKWSYKVAWGLREAEKVRVDIEGLRSGFLTVGEVAHRLSLSRVTVEKLCRSGSIKHMSICSSACNPRVYRYIIPSDEVQRLESKSRRDRKVRERAEDDGVSLVDAAKMLKIPYTTMYTWYVHGKLQVVPVGVGRQKELIVPRGELERLKRQFGRT